MTTAEHEIHEGRVPFYLAGRDTPCETWYQVHGDLHSKSTPLIVIHGGAGMPHGYLLPFRDLWTQHRIPVVFYDQIGCGNSTRLPETRGDTTFWQPGLFVDELENLLEYLEVSKDGGKGYDILGHSWGGTVAVEFAARQPAGLRRVVLAGAVASVDLLRMGILGRLRQLPVKIQNAVENAIDEMDFTSAEYQAAVGVLFSTFGCRARPFPPPELAVGLAALAEDDTVNSTIMGDSHFLWNGATKDYTAIPILPKISAPTLVMNGEFDSAVDAATVPFFQLIPRVRWVTLAGASHMPWLDSAVLRQKTMYLVAQFLLPEKTIPVPIEEVGSVLLD